jgi:hypothetical protein
MSVDEHEPLSPNVEALLDSVRTLDSEPEERRLRALARARAAVSMTALAPSVRPRFAGLGLKLAAAFVVAAAAVSAATVHFKAARKPAALAPNPVLQQAPSGAAPQASPSSQGEAPDPASSLEPDAVPRAAPAVSAHSAPERYALELEVLQPARAAVARGDFSAALSSIAEHHRRFPDGQLSEERDALRVQALSGLGRSEEASRAALAFRKRFPGSVLISHMKDL